MAKSKEPINWFYMLTAILGVAFTVTACGYGLLMLRTNRAASVTQPFDQQPHPLMNLLDQHGMAILAVEVGLLAVVSVAAIVLDHYRGKRGARERGKPN